MRVSKMLHVWLILWFVLAGRGSLVSAATTSTRVFSAADDPPPLEQQPVEGEGPALEPPANQGVEPPVEPVSEPPAEPAAEPPAEPAAERIVEPKVGERPEAAELDSSLNDSGEDDDEVEVLAKGPIHEAFAEPIVFDVVPGPGIPQPPPAAIEELPPDQRPAGDNVEWIDGYWAWDDDRDQYLWVSGFWRVMPPGRRWVPGYWTETQDGHRWVNGFWTSVSAAQITYLPQPPESQELGPSTEPATAEEFWVPGIWKWRDVRYVWRPGYWTSYRDGWTWVPAHYVWTPRGVIFVDGYWDFDPVHRGVLFAPVFFRPAIWTRPRYVFSPVIAVDCYRLTDHFFVSSRWHRYCYGDYYSTSYLNIGIQPWISFRSVRGCYDPLYYHYCAQYRSIPHWQRDWMNRYEHCRDNVSARPPHRVSPLALAGVAGAAVAVPTALHAAHSSHQVLTLKQVAARAEAPIKLQSLQKEQRHEQQQQAIKMREFTRQRLQTEVKTAAQPAKVGDAPINLPKIDLPKAQRNPKTGSNLANKKPQGDGVPIELRDDFRGDRRNRAPGEDPEAKVVGRNGQPTGDPKSKERNAAERSGNKAPGVVDRKPEEPIVDRRQRKSTPAESAIDPRRTGNVPMPPDGDDKTKQRDGGKTNKEVRPNEDRKQRDSSKPNDVSRPNDGINPRPARESMDDKKSAGDLRSRVEPPKDGNRERPSNDGRRARDAGNPGIDGTPARDVPRANDNRTRDVPRANDNRTRDVPRANDNKTRDVPRVNDNKPRDVPRVNDNKPRDVPRANDNKPRDVPRANDSRPAARDNEPRPRNDGPRADQGPNRDKRDKRNK